MTVPMLEKLGGSVRYTEFERTEYNGHWSWQYVFNNFYSEEYGETIMQWLAAQDRKLNAQKPSDNDADVSPSEMPSDDVTPDDSDVSKEGPSDNKTVSLTIIGVIITVVALVAVVIIFMSKRKPSGKK